MRSDDVLIVGSRRPELHNLSDVLLREIERIDAAVFADTGWETMATYVWLQFLQKESRKHGIPIHVVHKSSIKEDALVSQVRGVKAEGHRWASMPLFVLGPGGERGMIRRQCTNEYKIRLLDRKFRELEGFKPRQRIEPGTTEVWKGISIDEANRASMSDKKWISFYYPLIDMRMSRGDCLLWFKKKGLPEPPRSACIGCPYHSNHEWRRLKVDSPKEFAEAVAFDKAIRKCGGMRGDVFIHSARIPLDEVDLRNAEDKGQMSLFSDECMGVCGV